MKNLKKYLCGLLIFVMILCIGPPIKVEAANKIKINKSQQTLYVGQTSNLKISGTNKKTYWSSSNPKVATVSSVGKVTAKKSGTTVISAKISNKKYSCKITVKNPKLNVTKKNLYVKDKYTLKLTGAKVKSFTSNNKNIATVSNNGIVTAKKSGTAIITIKDTNGKKYNCNVTVKSPTLNTKAKSLNINGTYVLKLTGAKVKSFTSNNKNVATVASNGKVSAKKTGTAIITVTDINNTKYTCKITVNKCKHTWNKGSVTTKASCLKSGVKTYTCSICKDKKTENISASGHKWGKWAIVKEATEKATGEKKRSCSVCNQVEKEILPKKEHKHIYNTVVIEATCTEEGYTTYTCACGNNYKSDHVDALGHNWTEWAVTKEATETEVGEKKRNCSVCKIEETDIIPEKEHNHEYNPTETLPTCTEEGYTTYTCACGDNYKSDYVDALGHIWTEWTVIKEATETETGSKERECNVCSEVETDTIPMKGHNHEYDSTEILPTCTEEGYTTYTCTCGDNYKSDYVDALGHNWTEWTVTKEATETETGLKERECNVCSEVEIDTISVKTHEHIYTTIVTEPTCTVEGYTTYACACGDNYISDHIDSLGHDYSKPITTGDGTCVSPQMKWNQCSRCEEKQVVGMGTLEHSYDHVLVREATCTENGIEDYKCILCGYHIGSREIPATHAYSDWTVTKEPANGIHTTPADFGSKEKICLICNYSHKESIINIDLGNGETKQMCGTFADDMAYETLALVNELRAEVGVEPLTWENVFDDIGKIRAVEINYFYSHTRPNGGKAEYYIDEDFSIKLGENIWAGATIETAKIAVDGWATSSGHYANMVKETTKSYFCSCFITYDSSGNPWYNWVQLFSAY